VVGTGLGFAILSKATVAKEQKLGELVAVPLNPKLLRSLSLVYPKEKFRSRLVNTFVEFAQGRLKDTVL
jgi:DNA-binding transcriptional LysR family regulator